LHFKFAAGIHFASNLIAFLTFKTFSVFCGAVVLNKPHYCQPNLNAINSRKRSEKNWQCGTLPLMFFYLEKNRHHMLHNNRSNAASKLYMVNHFHPGVGTKEVVYLIV